MKEKKKSKSKQTKEDKSKSKKTTKKEKVKPEKKQYKLLIVDDDPDILLSVGKIFEKSGYEIICAEGGRQCMDFISASEEKPDLIILDIMMPIMSGWDVHRELSSSFKWRDIPIIFLTARGTETAKEMCIDRGCEYVRKPFDVEDLKKRVRKILNKK